MDARSFTDRRPFVALVIVPRSSCGSRGTSSGRLSSPRSRLCLRAARRPGAGPHRLAADRDRRRGLRRRRGHPRDPGLRPRRPHRERAGLLSASGPDSLATLLRELVGRDTIVIGGQTVAVADIARELQTRLLGVLSSPGDAVHIGAEVGSTLLEALLALIVTFYFLVDGPMLWHRTIEVLPFRHRDPHGRAARPDPRRARQVAPRPDRPDRPRGVRDIRRPRTDPPPPVRPRDRDPDRAARDHPADRAAHRDGHRGDRRVRPRRPPAVADRDRDLLRDPPGRGPGRDAAGHRAGRASPPGRDDLRGPRRGQRVRDPRWAARRPGRGRDQRRLPGVLRPARDDAARDRSARSATGGPARTARRAARATRSATGGPARAPPPGPEPAGA